VRVCLAIDIDPLIDVSVVRPGGQQMGAKQSTPGATRRRPQYINFNCSVHIQNTLEDIEPGSGVRSLIQSRLS
jgi:hypothetical protein